ANCTVNVAQPPPQVVCTLLSSATVSVGQTASFEGSGGNGTYSWSAPGGSPSSGNGYTFSTSYSTAGTKTVTVSSGGSSRTCSVNVTGSQTPSVTCSPS